LWLNDPGDSREFARFLHSENLFNRLASQASILAEVIFILGFQDFEVLTRAEDLTDVAGSDDPLVSRLLGEFFAPRLESSVDSALTCWTWGRHSGDLEVWTIRLLPDSISLLRSVREKHVGLTLPKL
jgi:hypothetical protein